jgi:hypothetical protein
MSGKLWSKIFTWTTVPSVLVASAAIYAAIRRPTGLLMAMLLGLLAGAAYSACFATATAYVQGRSVRRITGKSPTDATLDVVQKRAFLMSMPRDMAFEACVGVLGHIPGCSVISADPTSGVIVARSLPSYKTLGNTLTVRMSRSSERETAVHVVSRPIVPGTLFDYGSSLALVEQVVGEMHDASSRGATLLRAGNSPQTSELLRSGTSPKDPQNDELLRPHS